ncbi:protein SON isoform X2 [Melanotaenia boesemani]|uniref:protein SON isoform X2 n=1 Tax=Melanotaenia boesemani TaxID=1250792 RepID=UPI001C04CE0F|nr:protein SON isoform X2 [Melanotaenia boesemani]
MHSKNMAANIEQIFQDFILKKIKEIEDQNDDKPGAERVDGDSDTEEAEKNYSPERDRHRSGSQKRQKKHRKHKSKKKRRNQEKESSSESGPEKERERKHQTRSGTPISESKEQGEDNGSKSRCHKHHSTVKKKKKKKKKRRKKSEDNTSDSDSESVSKQRDAACGQSLSLRRQEELPDIIPKQESSNKGKRIEEAQGRRSCSPPHSCCHSNSLTSAHHCPGLSPHSESNSQCHRTRSNSSDKRDLDESMQSNLCPSKHLQPPVHALSLNQTHIQAEETAKLRFEDLQGPDQKELASEKMEKQAEKQGSGLSESTSTESEKPPECDLRQCKPSDTPSSSHASVKSPTRKRRKQSKSPQRSRERKSSKKKKRSKSPYRSYRRRSRSRSPSVRKRSRSRSTDRRSRRSRSRSASGSRRRATYSQRDRWKREPSHSPVLILRKNRSPSRKNRSRSNSPHRISELDKEQLLEIAKANAAAMCVKAGMPIPASLRSTVLPLTLPSMAMNAAMASMTAATVTAALSNMGTLTSLLPLSSINNKLPPLPTQTNAASLEEMKKKVAKQANSISIKEFTDKCKMIVDSAGELPVAAPHVSDEEDDDRPFGGAAIREQKVINFNINNTTVRPSVRSDAGIAKEFPVSSGSQHRKKEGDGLGAYGEWIPVDKTTDKTAAASRKALTNVPIATSTLSSADTAAGLPDVEQPVPVTENSVFPDAPQQPVDITQAVTERIKAQKRLAENPNDISAICMLSRAQEQVDAWAQSSYVPGLFTGSTGAQVLSSEELSTSGPQAWLKKDQFLRAAPVSGGVGEFLMRKMGWRTGEGLGRNREGTVEPIVIDFKVDRKGLVAEGEKPQKQTGGLVVTKDLMGKHPVSALIELCNKKRIIQPEFVMVHHSGPDHRKNFLFKVTVNGVDYQPQTASPNKKHAKAMAATVALQALGEVPVDGPGLYTGPVFTAASTGPLFST